jgi:putative transposase
MTKRSPFRYFKTSPEIIRLAVMMYVQFPLSLRNVEDLLHERGINISHETIRFWWSRFGPLFAAEVRRKRVQHLRTHSNWKWHLDEVFVKIHGETHYLWRAVDHEGEVLESYVTKRRDRKAALKFRKTMKRFGPPHVIVTDLLRSYGAAMKVIGNADRQEAGRWLNNRAENSCRSSSPFTPPFAIISTRNVTFTHATTSSSTAAPHWLSGVSWAWHKGQPRFPYGDWFAFV